MKFPSCPLLFAMFFLFSPPSEAQLSQKPVGLTPTETWVLEQINAGEIANLYRYQYADRSHSENRRTISAHFVEQVLLGTLPQLKVHRNGVLIYGAMIKQAIHLTNVRLKSDIALMSCTFQESITLSKSTFDGTLSFQGCRFKKGATFTRLKIAGNADFSHIVFDGPTDFARTSVGSILTMNDSEFNDSANFNSFTCGSLARFQGAVFIGPANFGGTVFHGQLDMDEVQFRSDEPLIFNTLTVRETAFFRKAIFEGPVDFFAKIGGSFEASEAEFRFEPKDPLTWLDINCDGRGFFNKTKFLGHVSFSDSTYSKLAMTGLNEGGDPVPNLNMSRVRVKGLLSLKNSRINVLNAVSLRIEGPTELAGLSVSGSADLRHSHFDTLDLSNATWPAIKGGLKLQGMKYEYITAHVDDENDSHRRLLQLLAQSDYSADVYKNLETFFVKQGYRDNADRAFIASKKRERKEKLKGAAWFGSWVLYLLVGNGRHPVYAGGLCLILIAIGCVAFSAKKMQLQVKQEKGDPPRVYNRFWYSLGLFLPFVDLHMDRLWKPKRSHTILRNYVRVHILAGWVFVPIFLAALTGLIK